MVTGLTGQAAGPASPGEVPAGPVPPDNAGAPEEPQEPDPSESVAMSADEEQVLALLNEARAQAGLAPLKPHAQVMETARAKAQDLLDYDYFDHVSPRLGSPYDQMTTAGIVYKAAAENLAAASTVQKGMQILMESPGHRANILSPSFTHVGIGVARGGPYGMYMTQQFIAK